MKMKLIDVVRAYVATDAMRSLEFAFDLSLALVRVRKATAEEAIFYINNERELALRFAELDENLKMKVLPNGSFVFKAGASEEEFERLRKELADTAVEFSLPVSRVRPPAEIRPEWIEALEGFIEFVDG